MAKSLIEIIKSKLPNPPDDNELESHIEEVAQSILNYCNISEVPEALRFVHANMVVDFIKIQNRSNDSEGQQAVTSIKEGDVTVQFGSVKKESGEQVMENILFDYKDQLKRFRKLRW
ncbi:head-tail connector protein [Cytobacillus firmus]|uniref:hypothetical protein n=1 Tax=Cytobacillus firmus TaxID=1399 RepID=UPI0018CF8FB5|nr:hypothetical protein [Cytobacillus firmus]MBG9548343.1 hypothetical protein [Cytobacillus firmus]MBG9600807.1 hypothetical protein [Cytobacillus firmus]MED1938937.1 hypothetical protein [Cytobacillus firmus]